MTHTFTTAIQDQEVTITYAYHRAWGDQPAWIDIQKVTPNGKWDEAWIMQECIEYQRDMGMWGEP